MTMSNDNNDIISVWDRDVTNYGNHPEKNY